MGKRKRKYLPVAQATTPDGEVFEVNTAEQQMLQEIKDSESKVVASIRAGLNGKHEPARVTSAAKVLEALDDPNTPDSLRDKLEALREETMGALLDVSQNGLVAAARAQANAIWLRAARGVGRLDWPPNEQDPVFSDRFDQVCKMCIADYPRHEST
jgi:hypothetical protein